MNKRTMFIIVLICIQLIIVASICWHIYQKRSGAVLGSIQITPLRKTALFFPDDSDFHYYWELQPDSVEVQTVGWLSNPGKHTINSDGLNERYNYALVPSPKTYRIVALGDSFTDGAFVNTADNWPEQLEDMLNARMRCTNVDTFEVINLGVGGHDAQYVLERYKRKGIKYRPDVVIFLTLDNDYQQVNEDLIGLKDKYDTLIENAGTWDHYRAIGEPNKAFDLAFQEYVDLGKYDEQANIKHELTYVKELLSLHTGPFILYTFSWLPRAILEPIRMLSAARPDTYVLATIDAYDHFPDYHPNKEGYRQFAEELYSFLKREIIPCL